MSITETKKYLIKYYGILVPVPIMVWMSKIELYVSQNKTKKARKLLDKVHDFIQKDREHEKNV